MRDFFLVLSPDGRRVLDVQDNAQDAINAASLAARREGKPGVYLDKESMEAPATREAVRNPPAPRTQQPMAAFYASQLSAGFQRTGGEPVGRVGKNVLYGATRRSIEAISLREALDRVRDWLPAARTRDSLIKKTGALRAASGNTAWDTPSGAAGSMLNQNSKMSKTGIEHLRELTGKVLKASAEGLSLLPHYLAARQTVLNEPVLVSGTGLRGQNLRGAQLGPSFFSNNLEAMQAHYASETRGGEATFCMGSSAECRRTCLAYSGQNQVSDEAVIAKHALSAALVHDPMAFTRLLVEAMRKVMSYKGTGDKKTKPGGWEDGAWREYIREYGHLPLTKWIRLNVYQDLPWEVMFPDLFDAEGPTSDKAGGWLGALRCYDYTKVPGRAFMPNYHLTFSYAGDNRSQCLEELHAGRNVAAVFVRTSKAGAGAEVFSRTTGPWKGDIPQGLLFPLLQRIPRKVGKKDKGDRRPLRQIEHGLLTPIEGHGFGDIPVLNGDLHDLRAYDQLVLDKIGWGQGGALVALDFKVPLVKVGKLKMVPLYSLADAGAFVQRVHQAEPGGVYMAAVSGAALSRYEDPRLTVAIQEAGGG